MGFSVEGVVRQLRTGLGYGKRDLERDLGVYSFVRAVVKRLKSFGLLGRRRNDDSMISATASPRPPPA